MFSDFGWKQGNETEIGVIRWCLYAVYSRRTVPGRSSAMHSLEAAYLSRLSFTTKDLAFLHALGECRGKQALFFRQSPQALETLHEVARVESSESSNRLEGISVPHKRVADLVVKNTTQSPGSSTSGAHYCGLIASSRSGLVRFVLVLEQRPSRSAKQSREGLLHFRSRSSRPTARA